MTVKAMNIVTRKIVQYDALNVYTDHKGLLHVIFLDPKDNYKMVTVSLAYQTHYINIDP